MKIGALILAAGSASRMGMAKMLLPLQETTILEHIITSISKVSDAPIYIVTGFYHHEIKLALDNTLVKFVFNKDWQLGMSSSIRAGLNQLLTDIPNLESVLIAVSDQPFLSSSIIAELIHQQSLTRKPIIAAEYGAIKGTPVLFGKSYFAQLLNLTGDTGARAILQAHPEAVVTIPFLMGKMDIDTPADYEQLCSILKNSHVD